MITAQIIADSINPIGVRLTSYLLTYPRFIHSELMTHRAFSRNAASSRAIPLAKMIDDVLKNPAMPERWPAEQRGMQGGESIPPFSEKLAKDWWKQSREDCAHWANAMARDTNLHKSLCNRIIEPWAHMSVIVTAADRGFENFFGLRAHKDAQPEFQVLAFRMLDLFLKSEPRKLFWDHWHIPFDESGNIYAGSVEANREVIAAAVGRIASVSYNRQEINDPEKNIAIHDRLASAGHWSPFEHVAKAWDSARHSSNFDVGYLNETTGCGWIQYRKEFIEELRSPDLEDLMAEKPEWITV